MKFEKIMARAAEPHLGNSLFLLFLRSPLISIKQISTFCMLLLNNEWRSVNNETRLIQGPSLKSKSTNVPRCIEPANFPFRRNEGAVKTFVRDFISWVIRGYMLPTKSLAMAAAINLQDPTHTQKNKTNEKKNGQRKSVQGKIIPSLPPI